MNTNKKKVHYVILKIVIIQVVIVPVINNLKYGT